MAAITLSATREATAPATGGGLCVLSNGEKDNDDGFVREML